MFVVIDTITSHAEGNENDAEPYREMANLLTSKLVILNISSLTLDHVGKKEKAGGRGSSAKRDAFDVIWHLKTNADSYILKKDKGRARSRKPPTTTPRPNLTHGYDRRAT